MNETIGRLTVTRAFRERQHSEFAAWYTDVEVQPGTYDVLARLEGGLLRHSAATVDAVVVEDYYEAHYFGLPLSAQGVGKGYDRTQNAGKRTEHSLYVYVASTVVNGGRVTRRIDGEDVEVGHFDLAPGWRIVSTPFYNGDEPHGFWDPLYRVERDTRTYDGPLVETVRTVDASLVGAKADERGMGYHCGFGALYPTGPDDLEWRVECARCERLTYLPFATVDHKVACGACGTVPNRYALSGRIEWMRDRVQREMAARRAAASRYRPAAS